MKRILVCGAALSLMLLACGDDSSSGPETVTGGNESGSEIDSSASQSPESSGMGAVSKADDKSSSSSVPASSETNPGSSAGVPESSNGTSPESSGGTSPESSSSVLTPKQEASDIVAECGDGLDENNAVSPAPADTGVTLLVEVAVDGPGGTPPVAYKYEGSNDSVTYVAERVMMPCEIAITGITVSAVGDTLFANVSVDPDAPVTNCICNTRVSFKIEKDSRFTQATRLVIDDNRLMTYRIVSETIDPVVDDKIQNRVLAGKCMADDAVSEQRRGYGAAPAASNPLYANLVYDPVGFYYLQIENIEANCGIGQAKMVQEMQGDTLSMEYDGSSELLRCMCVFDELKFVVSEENVDATYFSFSGIVYKIARLQKSF